MNIEKENINEVRLRALYEATAQSNAPIADQFHAALAIGSQTLKTNLAIVSRIKDDAFTVMYCVVPPNTIKEGDVFPLAQTYCDITVKKNEVLAIDEMRASAYDAHPCHDRFKLESYIGVPINVNGELYGTINFSDPDPHRPSFSESDRDFVRLMSKWASATIERQLAADAITAEKEKLRVILEQMPVGVLLAEAPSGKIVMANQMMINILGRGIDPATANIHEADFYQITHENGEPYNPEELPLAETLRTGVTSTKTDIFVHHPDNVVVNTRGTAVPVKDASGNMISVIGVIEDTTKEREVDKMKSEFISLASHQLRTPLTGIRWFADLLLKGKAGEISATQKDFIQQIYDSNARLIKLVEELLNISHIETGNKFNLVMQPTDIAPIINSLTTDMVALAAQHQVTIVKGEEFPVQCMLNVDGDKMREVLQNLMSNAVKYSKLGGTGTIGINKEGNETIISVADQGLGIPKAQQGRMFEKFFRADNVQSAETDGTGLGLYIAKAITEKHGGKIWFESEENKGTTFYISLPALSRIEGPKN